MDPGLKRDPLGRWLPRHAAWAGLRAQLVNRAPAPILYGEVSRWDPWRRRARAWWRDPRALGVALGLALMLLGLALFLLGR